MKWPDWILHQHPDVAWSILTAWVLAALYIARKWVIPMWSRHRESVRQRVETLAGVRELLEQMRPNGGSSLLDRVAAIQSGIRELRGEVTCLHAGLGFLYDQSPDGVFWADAQGNVTQTSRAFTRWTGWQESELLGGNWVKIIPQDERQNVVAQWHDAVRQGIDFSLSYRYQDSDGNTFSVHTEASPILQDGAVVAYRGTVRRLG